MFSIKHGAKLVPHKRSYTYKYLHILPHLLSFTSAVLGFFSLIQSAQGRSVLAAYAILCAAFLDACDGRVARALGIETMFGKELDALVDVISFCLAPAVLLYCTYVTHGFSIIVFITLAFFVCAGLFRLARFNSTRGLMDGFIGLPTTAAACYLATLMLWFNEHPSVRMIPARTTTLFIAVVLALLMVSSCVFPAFKRTKKWLTETQVAALMVSVCLLLCYTHEYGILLASQTCYIMSCLVYASCGYARRSRIVRFYR